MKPIVMVVLNSVVPRGSDANPWSSTVMRCPKESKTYDHLPSIDMPWQNLFHSPPRTGIRRFSISA
jgi:hypothetical protein